MHQHLQQGAVSLPVIPTTLPKKNNGGGSKGFPQEALVAPSPSQNQAFLQSAAGRTARLVCELEEYPRRMSSFGIRGTFLVFGSARSKYGWQIDELIDEQKALIEKVGKGSLNEDQKKKVRAAKARIDSLEGLRWTAEWMDKTEALCHRLTEWALSPVGRSVGMHCRSNMLPNDYSSMTASAQAKWYNGYAAPLAAAAAGMVVVDGRSVAAAGDASKGESGAITNATNSKNSLTLSYAFEQPLVVCSGGGPGFMEAANKGAYEANGVSMGVGITLPFETHLNSYVTPGLHFNTDYFFTRKFWEVFSAKAMIVCPGGMGTCDEMFEVLTLMQCGHSQMMPVVLLGKKFWTECINFPSLAKYNMISKKEVEDLCITDSVDEAFDFIVSFLIREAEAEKKKLATALKAKL